jgi:selT/selW/selH-like putative selenoprotein
VIHKQRAGVETKLIKGHGGVFEVVLDGTPIFSKKASGRFPDEGEVLEKIPVTT